MKIILAFIIMVFSISATANQVQVYFIAATSNPTVKYHHLRCRIDGLRFSTVLSSTQSGSVFIPQGRNYTCRATFTFKDRPIDSSESIDCRIINLPNIPDKVHFKGSDFQLRELTIKTQYLGSPDCTIKVAD